MLKRCALPTAAFLRPYVGMGAYTDCYSTVLPGVVPLADYIESFYSNGLFKLERMILKRAFGKAATQTELDDLAHGRTDEFIVWRVAARDGQQVLLCDWTKRTRSWLMLSSEQCTDGLRTRLFFGSAVVPMRGKSTLSVQFYLLLGVHKLYARASLFAARAHLLKRRQK